jgi:lysozyme
MAYAAGEDRSSFQPVTAWAGDTFGFAKATEGTDWSDPAFAANWANLKREGLVRGAYHFFHPADDPVTQARFFTVSVKNQGLAPGDVLIADVEITLAADGFEDLGADHAGTRMHEYLKAVPRGATAGLVGPAALEFLNEVAALAPGYRVLLYTDLTMALNDLTACSAYPLFIASYAPGPPGSTGPWPSWAFWQDGRAGPGGGDRDYFNGDAAALTAWAAGNYWTEALVDNLPTLQLGSADGAPDTTWYVHRLRNEVAGYGRWNGLGAVTALPDGGTYDAATKAAVEAVQEHAGITRDGIAGPQTWGILIA